MVDEHDEGVLTRLALLAETDDQRVLVAEHVRDDPTSGRGDPPDRPEPAGRTSDDPSQLSDHQWREAVMGRRYYRAEGSGDSRSTLVAAFPASLEQRLLEGWDVHAVKPGLQAGRRSNIASMALAHISAAIGSSPSRRPRPPESMIWSTGEPSDLWSPTGRRCGGRVPLGVTRPPLRLSLAMASSSADLGGPRGHPHLHETFETPSVDRVPALTRILDRAEPFLGRGVTWAVSSGPSPTDGGPTLRDAGAAPTADHAD